MENVVGIISTNYRTTFLQGMSQGRPIAVVPFGGSYKLLDFALSNMVNSGLKKVGIITPVKYRPILDYLGAGNEWSLNRKTRGMFILPGANYSSNEREIKFYLGDFLKNVQFLERESADYIIISGCNNIFKLDYSLILEFHEKNKADISLIYKNVSGIPEDEKYGYILKTYPNGRTEGIEQESPTDNKVPIKLFADMLIVSRVRFLELICGNASMENVDLLDVIKGNLNSLKVFAFEHKGYFGRIYSSQSYYKCTMDVLLPEIKSELFMDSNKIRSKVIDYPPTKYGDHGSSVDSLISSGCSIMGQVERSILFGGVRVESGAVIKNSIIMQESHIGRDSVLENVILDKYVRINDRTVLKGLGDIPVVISKYEVV